MTVRAIDAVDELSTEIRPGVLRPDWTAVTGPAARKALNGRMSARAGLLHKWSHALDPDEDRVWRTLLRLYADRGRAPEPTAIAFATGLPDHRVATLLRKLHRRDLVGLAPRSVRIRHAYPFTEHATGHRVRIGGHVLNALCAIDALGVAEMYEAEITVSATCRSCGEPLTVTTTENGRALRSVSPAEAVVWYDFAYADNAASSCCPLIAFFCSDEDLQGWLDVQEPRRLGARLNMDEALELGRAIFAPVLRDSMLAPA